MYRVRETNCTGQDYTALYSTVHTVRKVKTQDHAVGAQKPRESGGISGEH